MHITSGYQQPSNPPAPPEPITLRVGHLGAPWLLLIRVLLDGQSVRHPQTDHLSRRGICFVLSEHRQHLNVLSPKAGVNQYTGFVAADADQPVLLCSTPSLRGKISRGDEGPVDGRRGGGG